MSSLKGQTRSTGHDMGKHLCWQRQSQAQSGDHSVLLDDIVDAIASGWIAANCEDHQVPTLLGLSHQSLHILLSESVIVLYDFLHADSPLRSICKKVLAIAHAIGECKNVHLRRGLWLWNLKNILQQDGKSVDGTSVKAPNEDMM